MVFSVCRLNHDVQNIIEMMVFIHRLKNTNKKYRQVFHFFDVLYYVNRCPNPHGRCVTKYIDITIHWLDGKIHRNPMEGPAIEWANGTKEWYVNDQCHREDGPAIEWANGTKEWYVKGKLHKEDGPAIEYANGYKAWYLNGLQIKNR